MNASSGTSNAAALRRRLWSYGLTTLAVIAATLLTSLISPLQRTPAILFFAAIVIGAWQPGIGPAILAIAASFLIVDYCFLPPLSMLTSLTDLLILATACGIGLSIVHFRVRFERITDQLRRVNESLETRVHERTLALQTANQSLLQEIRDRQQTEAALKDSEAKLTHALAHVEASLHEKNVLIRELNHRVKNNLQMITSLLGLQVRGVENQFCRDLVRDCQHRIRAMALVHNQLCDASNLTQVDATVYFQQLVQQLFRCYCIDPAAVTWRVVCDDAKIGIDQFMCCGLIVNELVSNAFKYAFPDGQSGEVQVKLQRGDGCFALSVIDDGIGFSPQDQSAHRGVGLQIVEALVEQHSGQIHWKNERGSHVTVTFPGNC